MYIKLTERQQLIVVISLTFLIISIFLQVDEYLANKEPYTISYESVNIRDMTEPHISTKISKTGQEEIYKELGDVAEVKMESLNLSATDTTNSGKPSRIWYLPTQIGSITTYPNMGHVAYDITSWRGTAETIYPVAEGTVSGMYTDSYGALIVTVLHNVNGKKYTSQYVHLSRYANGLYVGKHVSINDPLGQMGSTGWSTGTHLHIAVLDCALFDPKDPNCYDLNAWYRYDKKRLSENFYGLGVLMYVPHSWKSR